MGPRSVLTILRIAGVNNNIPSIKKARKANVNIRIAVGISKYINAVPVQIMKPSINAVVLSIRNTAVLGPMSTFSFFKKYRSVRSPKFAGKILRAAHMYNPMLKHLG